MRSGNPFFNERMYQVDGNAVAASDTTTVQGAVTKTLILTAILVAMAVVGWSLALSNPPLALLLAIGGAIVGLIVVLIMSFKPATSPYLAQVYAIGEGLFLGAISAFMQARYPGIVAPAVGLTVGTLFFMLAAYKTGLIKVTEKFKLGVIAATGAVALFYLVCMVLRLFNVHIPYIHEGGAIGIGVSAVVIVIAALNLALDFDNFERAEEAAAPKYYEWYLAVGLLVTIVWLYIEFLKLLAKLQRR